MKFLICVILFYIFSTSTAFAAVCPDDGVTRSSTQKFVNMDDSVTMSCTRDSDATAILWYKYNGTHDNQIVLYISITSAVIWTSPYSATDYTYNTADSSLTINSVTLQDEQCYRCLNIKPNADGLYDAVNIKVLVAPSVIRLESSLNSFEENMNTEITCVIPSLKPGKGSVIFKVKLRSGVIATSSNNAGDESTNTDGTVSLTYTTEISLNRTQSGQQLVCEITWRSGNTSEKTLSSQSVTANVLFEPTYINMTISPSNHILVAEDTVVTLTCETDEGNPTPSIVWSQNVDSGFTSDTVINGSFNAQKRRSMYEITANRVLNGATYICKSGTGREKSFTLNVKFPHHITIYQSPSTVPNENDAVNLTCIATGGNPASVNSYEWRFTARYGVTGGFLQTTSRTLQVSNNVDYTNAGNYTCVATNAGGNNSSVIQLLVAFPAKDISQVYQKVATAAIGNSTQVNCTVRAYPPIMPDDVEIYIHNTKLSNNFISVQSSEVDISTIILTISSVTAADFGNYTVKVINSVGVQNITMEINERGPPSPPNNLNVVEVTATTANVSWESNRDGGYSQTFTVLYKMLSNDNYIYSDPISDPGVGHIVMYTIKGLHENIQHEFKVVAANEQSKTETRLMTFKTLALPVLQGPKKALLMTSNSITFTWSQIVGNYTSVKIEKCLSSVVSCEILRIISNRTIQTVTIRVENAQTFTYNLLIYQNDVEVYRDVFLLQKLKDTSNLGSIIGAVVGVFAGLVVIGVVVVVIFVTRKQKSEKYKDKTEEQPQTDLGNVMEAGLPGSVIYADVDKNNKSKSKKAADVQPVGKGLPGSVIYADVDKNNKSKSNKATDVQPAGEGLPGSVIYADVDKSKSNKAADVQPAGEVLPGSVIYAEVDKNNKSKTKKAADIQPVGEDKIQNNDVYANVSPDQNKLQNQDLNEGAYANVEGVIGRSLAESDRHVDQDGLTYVQLEFQDKPKKAQDRETVATTVIHGDAATEYSSVDFAKSPYE